MQALGHAMGYMCFCGPCEVGYMKVILALELAQGFGALAVHAAGLALANVVT